jgi:hypothetical protein
MKSALWPRTSIDWRPAYRVVPTRFPSVYLYDRVASPEDFDALYALEAMTNQRLRDEAGQIELVPPEERLFGYGTGPIMAAFTHLNPLGSRFSDGSYGVFYAAHEKETAIAETRHHTAVFLAATNEAAIRVQMRLYCVDVVGEVADLRNAGADQPGILAPDSYAEAQTLGKQLRAEGAAGLIYPSVRRSDNKGRGECVAAFKTGLLKSCLHAAHLEYHWDGRRIDYVTQQLE